MVPLSTISPESTLQTRQQLKDRLNVLFFSFSPPIFVLENTLLYYS